MSSGPNPPGGMAEPGGNDDRVAGDEANQRFWDVAARIRGERERWVVIRLWRERRFRAYPKFRLPAGMTSANGSTRDELLADIDRIEQAADCPGYVPAATTPRKPAIAGQPRDSWPAPVSPPQAPACVRYPGRPEESGSRAETGMPGEPGRTGPQKQERGMPDAGHSR